MDKGYSKEEFIKECLSMSYSDVREKALKEHKSVPEVTKKENNKMWQYKDFLNELLVLLESGRMPAGLSKPDRLLVKPLIQEFVRKGQMREGVLQLFQD